MNNLILVLKGFVIGIGKIIPGVSGAMLAISFGLYERCLEAITNFFKDIKGNFKLLFPLGIGIAGAIVLGSKIIAFLLTKFYLPTILLFIGLILGGMPSFIKEVTSSPVTIKRKLAFTICFLLVFLLSFIKIDNQYFIYPNYKTLIYFMMGIIDAATMVIPGISGTAIFMLLGVYEISLALFSNLTSISNIIINLPLLIPFGCGLVIGIIIVSVLMTKCLNTHKEATYYGILGFQLSALILIFSECFNTTYSLFTIIISFFFMVLGFMVGKKLE